MDFSNDNRPPPEASRVLPIIGRVDARGAVILTPPGGRGVGDDEPAPGPFFPSDPREA